MAEAEPSSEFLALQAAVAGRFSLERELGRGGMGIVFLARDVALDRPVAVKLLPLALAGLPQLRQRFLREARTAARLSHPNIVPIHSVEEHGNLVFFVMGYVRGETLRQRVQRAGPLPLADATRVLQEVAWALAYAHTNGIVHRDVKPDNIMIEAPSGRALVTDFGIARVADEGGMTSDGELIGTAHYMSPEQAAGEPVSPRSDLYSLGVTAFYALTGRLPFEAPTIQAALAMHIAEPAPPVASLRDDLPPQLAEAVDGCLAKDPADRPASGEALARAVGAARGVGIEAPPQVRAFLRDAQRMGIELGAYAGGLVTALAYLGEPAAVATAGLGLLIAWLLRVGQVSRTARGILADGTTFADVRAALLADARAQVEEVQRVKLHRERRGRFLPADPETAAVAGVIAGGVVVALIAAGPALGVVGYLMAVPFLCAGLLYGGYALGSEPVERLFERLRTSTWSIGLWNRLWAGWPGRWFFKLSAVVPIESETEPEGALRPGSVAWRKARKAVRHPMPGLPAGTFQVIEESTEAGGATGASPAPSTDPTEILLGRAATAAFDRLPAAQRARLTTVPDVIRRLERRARALRAREREVGRLWVEAGGARKHGSAASDPTHSETDPATTVADRRASLLADLEAERRRLGERLATAVAALENVRLGLLRLQAGLGSVDDLTADLAAAAEIGRQVDRELGVRDVAAGRRQGTRESPSE